MAPGRAAEIVGATAIACAPASSTHPLGTHHHVTVTPGSAPRDTTGPHRALVGCAGWSLPRPDRDRFAEGASNLERYASRFPAVEINSSFYRPHQPSTYARWSATVPAEFRFSVKVPKTITHGARLQRTTELLDAFIAESSALGEKLGCFLVQLPPSLIFDAAVLESFFTDFRVRSTVPIACEPRHPSWFEPAAGDLLATLQIARVAADPARVPAAALPGGSPHLSYYRLHGSPRTYYSAYTPQYIESLATRIQGELRDGKLVWCIFDNTALGAATSNALELLGLIQAS